MPSDVPAHETAGASCLSAIGSVGDRMSRPELRTCHARALRASDSGGRGMHNDRTAARTSGSSRKLLLGLAAVIIVLGGGIAVWTSTCPCNRLPGFVLLGGVHQEPVTDWSFVNDVPLCQIQIS